MVVIKTNLFYIIFPLINMSINCYNNNGYRTLKTTWVKQNKYNLASSVDVKENFGAFSIRAAVRGPHSNKWANPWTRQETCHEGCKNTYHGVN
jgi:hypothetical protein